MGVGLVVGGVKSLASMNTGGVPPVPPERFLFGGSLGDGEVAELQRAVVEADADDGFFRGVAIVSDLDLIFVADLDAG